MHPRVSFFLALAAFLVLVAAGAAWWEYARTLPPLPVYAPAASVPASSVPAIAAPASPSVFPPAAPEGPASFGFEVLVPQQGTTWRMGSAYPVSWRVTTSTPAAEVDISLIRVLGGKNGPIAYVAPEAPNSGSFLFAVPDVEPGNYFVMVGARTCVVTRDASDTFEGASCPWAPSGESGAITITR